MNDVRITNGKRRATTWKRVEWELRISRTTGEASLCNAGEVWFDNTGRAYVAREIQVKDRNSRRIMRIPLDREWYVGYLDEASIPAGRVRISLDVKANQ